MKTKKEELQKQLNAIQKELDNFKEEPKSEIGKWYVSDKGIYLYNYQGSKSYGFGWDNKWSNNLCTNSSLDGFRLATDKEVEEALIKEAKKRGFKEGVSFNVVGENKIIKIINDKLDFDDIDENIIYIDCWYVFYNGKWAEIIEDSKPKINGYEMEIIKGCSGGKVVKFGCQKFDAKNVITFYEIAKKLNLQSFKIDENIILFRQLKEVVDYLNK